MSDGVGMGVGVGAVLWGIHCHLRKGLHLFTQSPGDTPSLPGSQGEEKRPCRKERPSWRSEDSLRESVHRVDPGIELRLSGLAAGAMSHLSWPVLKCLRQL